jgi:hypothetical protein
MNSCANVFGVAVQFLIYEEGRWFRVPSTQNWVHMYRISYPQRTELKSLNGPRHQIFNVCAFRGMVSYLYCF